MVANKNQVQVFIASLLIAVGALITLLCGACTAGFMVVVTAGAFHGGNIDWNAFSNAFWPLTIGGIPTIAGVAILRTGLSMKRRAEKNHKSTDWFS